MFRNIPFLEMYSIFSRGGLTHYEEQFINDKLEWYPININGQCSTTGMTLLHLAVERDLVDVVYTLLNQEDVDISIKNNTGLTARQLATTLGNKQIIHLFNRHQKFLMEDGSKPFEEPIIFSNKALDKQHPLTREASYDFYDISSTTIHLSAVFIPCTNNQLDDLPLMNKANDATHKIDSQQNKSSPHLDAEYEYEPSALDFIFAGILSESPVNLTQDLKAPLIAPEKNKERSGLKK